MNLRLFFACGLLAACGAPNDPTSSAPVERIQYPETRKDSTAGDTLHGTFVADPYRWLENDTSAETATWVRWPRRTPSPTRSWKRSPSEAR
ncbi:MAG: hypothetical protein IPK99_14510 [Flavobacteriales bacterium]|nr:hypothetical protein [Flavobacteriales bacterium]